MIYVGIDVAKDKHDCCILGSDGEVLFSPFTIQNTLQGFDELYEKIWSLTYDLTEIKVGLEATGHYHLNLLRSLLDNGLPSFVINPLHTNLYRKGQSLTIILTFCARSLITACPALLSIRYTQIFTEKVKALERQKRIKSMLLRLL